MDEETREKVLRLLDRRLVDLTVREGAFLLSALEAHEDEILGLVPELRALLEG